MRKLLKNNWVVTVIGGVLSVLVLRLIDSLFINDFLWGGIKNIFGSIVDFFNTDYTIKLYFLVLLPILVIVAIIGIVLLIAFFSGKNSDGSDPSWVNYTKDVFGDLQFRWQYDFIGRRYEITNLQRLCDRCSCHLVDNKCPACRTNYSFGHQYPSREEVLALIVRNIDTGLYKKSKYFKS